MSLRLNNFLLKDRARYISFKSNLILEHKTFGEFLFTDILKTTSQNSWIDEHILEICNLQLYSCKWCLVLIYQYRFSSSDRISKNSLLISCCSLADSLAFAATNLRNDSSTLVAWSYSKCNARFSMLSLIVVTGLKITFNSSESFCQK